MYHFPASVTVTEILCLQIRSFIISARALANVEPMIAAMTTVNLNTQPVRTAFRKTQKLNRCGWSELGVWRLYNLLIKCTTADTLNSMLVAGSSRLYVAIQVLMFTTA